MAKGVFSLFDELNRARKEQKAIDRSRDSTNSDRVSAQKKVDILKNLVNKTDAMIGGSAELLQKVSPKAKKMIKKYKNNKKFWDRLKQ